MSRVAYLGPRGTFSQAALIELSRRGLLPGDVEQLPVTSTPAALDAVRSGDADFACVPIESSIEGSVAPTMDGLAFGAQLQILAELTLDVAFSIVVATSWTRAGRTAGDVRTVAAFPVAAAQVQRWLAEHVPAATIVPAISNAAAAEDVAQGRADAGVSTALAAELYSVDTLAGGVVDEPNARTRFVLVGPPGPPPPRTGADRTAVVLRLDHVPGALVAAMNEFAMRGIDLTRIESRPTRIELGTYVFFLDCAGHLDDPPVAEALAALYRRCADVRFLGSWPTDTPTGSVPPDATDATGWLDRLRRGAR